MAFVNHAGRTVSKASLAQHVPHLTKHQSLLCHSCTQPRVGLCEPHIPSGSVIPVPGMKNAMERLWTDSMLVKSTTLGLRYDIARESSSSSCFHRVRRLPSLTMCKFMIIYVHLCSSYVSLYFDLQNTPRVLQRGQIDKSIQNVQLLHAQCRNAVRARL